VGACLPCHAPTAVLKADRRCRRPPLPPGKRSDKGELAAIIRTDKTTCPKPPVPPPAPTPGPAVSIPASWTAREQAANMYIANEEPLVVGNGYIAAMSHTGVMHAAGVFNGDLDRGQAPVRADIPSVRTYGFSLTCTLTFTLLFAHFTHVSSVLGRLRSRVVFGRWRVGARRWSQRCVLDWGAFGGRGHTRD
jgi:hypothetical protein